MILSHMQIEEIASAVTKDFNEFFFGKDADNERSTAQATPIDQFAKDYLGLSVSFAHLSSDGSLCGLTAYRPVAIRQRMVSILGGAVSARAANSTLVLGCII